MSASARSSPAQSAWSPRLWYRTLNTYPSRGPQVAYLVVTVATTVAVYYQLFVTAGVATLQLEQFHMSFRYYMMMIALSNLAGAFASLTGRLCDRFGRANVIAYGLLCTSLLVLVALPHAPNKEMLLIETCLLGGIEGVVLVASPALIRDFSPQLDRGKAMGVWVLGPVIGTYLVSRVASSTLPVYKTWQSQYYICGAAGLLVFVIAVGWLRELSPQLRGQVVVSERERILLELRATGIDVAKSTRHAWRRVCRARILAPAIGYSLGLTIYFTMAAFGAIFFTTVFGFTLAQANGIAAWGWLADVVLAIACGWLSDRIAVRKPVIVACAALTAAAIAIFISMIGTHPSYGAAVAAMMFLSAPIGGFSGVWFASFTETVEELDPALTGAAFAVFGWIFRLLAFASILTLSLVVTASSSHPGSATPGQWRGWFLLCLLTEVAFIPLAAFLRGRWSPAAARADVRAYNQLLDERIAVAQGTPGSRGDLEQV